MGERIILHCDLNSFYASVELLDKPALWEVPVAVCGDPRTRHGIILAKNEPAKKYGIQTAETVWQAKKKCPGLMLLPPHHDLYKMWSVRVNDIYERFTMTATGRIPGRSTPSMTRTPIWWSPSPSTRAGWMSPAAFISSAATRKNWPIKFEKQSKMRLD